MQLLSVSDMSLINTLLPTNMPSPFTTIRLNFHRNFYNCSVLSYLFPTRDGSPQKGIVVNNENLNFQIDICVTVHYLYNNVNNKLGATITIY